MVSQYTHQSVYCNFYSQYIPKIPYDAKCPEEHWCFKKKNKCHGTFIIRMNEMNLVVKVVNKKIKINARDQMSTIRYMW